MKVLHEVRAVNAKQIWQTTMERLQTRVTPAVFTTWFQGTAARSFEDGVFVVHVPSIFARSHLEARFTDEVRSILEEVTGNHVEVRFVMAKEAPVAGELSQASAALGEEEEAPGAGKRANRPARSRPGFLRRVREKREPEGEASIISMASNAPAASRPVAHLSSGDPWQPDEYAQTQVPANRQVPQTYPRSTPQDRFPFDTGQILIPRYTFSTFIVGKSNQLAHAASLAVADDPGHIYNPLFFYGGVGLGKTHLLHAIGHTGEANGLNVLYVTSEKFTNEIVNAIRYQKTEEFRAKYRRIDILLVDDIQFIAGKESTEEEFFHTFNALYDDNKQIVVTSDRPPKAISSLQDRLRSRFEWGLLADVQAPEYEHRQAILRAKTESLRFPVPTQVIDYISRAERSSVRELEGALNRVIAYATLHDAPLSVNLAAQALEHIYSATKPTSMLSVKQVLEGVCRYYNVDPERLRGKQRDREIVWPRQVAMYVMREETDASLFQIGVELGGRDHTTIMHGWEKVQAEVTNNDRVRHEIAAVLEAIEHGK